MMSEVTEVSVAPDIRIIVFLERAKWIAQCLEYDICAQGDSPREAFNRFVETLELDFSECLIGGRDLEEIGPAPLGFERLWPLGADFPFRGLSNFQITLAPVSQSSPYSRVIKGKLRVLF